VLERAGAGALCAGVPDDEMGRKHAEGWGWMLGMLVEKFAAKAG
jgi:hypothetical protein